jgi:transposase
MLEEILPAPDRHDPAEQVIATEEFARLSGALAGSLSQIERKALFGIGDGVSYEDLARANGVSVKTIDNAAQRAKRKVAEALDPEPPAKPERKSIHRDRAEQAIAFISQRPSGVSARQIMNALAFEPHQWQDCRSLVEDRVRFAGLRRDRLFFPPAPVAA